MMNKNVFVKPNGQSRACASYAMAKKQLLKTNLFLSILFLLAASAAGAQEPLVTEAEIERQEQQRARETTEQRVEQAVEGELQELLERIPDSLRVDKWIPGTVVVDGHILEPVPLHKPEMERWSMPRQQQVTPIERDFVRRLTSGWLAVSNGQAFNWEYGRRIWAWEASIRAAISTPAPSRSLCRDKTDPRRSSQKPPDRHTGSFRVFWYFHVGKSGNIFRTLRLQNNPYDP